MSDFIEREKQLDDLTDRINLTWQDVNRRARRVVELKQAEINLVLEQSLNLREQYRVVDEEVRILEEAVTRHRLTVEQELMTGDVDEENWRAVEERERQLREIRDRLNNDIATSEENSNGLREAMEEEERAWAANRELANQLEQEKDRLMRVPEQQGPGKSG